MNDIDDPKLKQIVKTAKTLFWKYGIRRVTIEEICREANVSKMTFYKHFANKAELAKFIYIKIQSEAMDKYQRIMAQPIPYPEKVKQSILLKIEFTDEISKEFITDFYKTADPELVQFFNQKMKEGIQQVLNDFIDAQARGDLRPDIKPEFIQFFLEQMRDMLQDERLIRLYNSPQDLIIELINFLFYGILPRDEKIEE
ncbi:TetR/AcrR family transcriptional regulator [candidate division KSB1 bacterium]|nr:TetR/AcrR family transcriptional regulator [candidate division KSB1 bacterium]